MAVDNEIRDLLTLLRDAPELEFSHRDLVDIAKSRKGALDIVKKGSPSLLPYLSESSPARLVAEEVFPFLEETKELRERKIPFGKYKGRTFKSIAESPSISKYHGEGYLKWAKDFKKRSRGRWKGFNVFPKDRESAKASISIKHLLERLPAKIAGKYENLKDVLPIGGNVYHLTPEENVRSILKKGLIPTESQTKNPMAFFKAGAPLPTKRAGNKYGVFFGFEPDAGRLPFGGAGYDISEHITGLGVRGGSPVDQRREIIEEMLRERKQQPDLFKKHSKGWASGLLKELKGKPKGGLFVTPFEEALKRAHPDEIKRIFSGAMSFKKSDLFMPEIQTGAIPREATKMAMFDKKGSFLKYENVMKLVKRGGISAIIALALLPILSSLESSSSKGRGI